MSKIETMFDELESSIGRFDLTEHRAEFASLREKADWYDKVHEAKEPGYTDELDAAGLRDQLKIASHLAAEYMDAANIQPRELERLRKLANLVQKDGEDGVLVKALDEAILIAEYYLPGNKTEDDDVEKIDVLEKTLKLAREAMR